MNNETQPTPEQLAQWREAGAEAWMVDSNASTQEEHEDCYIAGYLRAKQENEQAVKELQNIANAKRFDKEAFLTDDDFCQWAQSRARFTLEKLGAAQ